jgi:transposase-like protein
MAKGYSKDLRERAIELVEAGESAREAARILNIGVSTAIRWADRWKKTGSVDGQARHRPLPLTKRTRASQHRSNPLVQSSQALQQARDVAKMPWRLVFLNPGFGPRSARRRRWSGSKKAVVVRGLTISMMPAPRPAVAVDSGAGVAQQHGSDAGA